MSSDRFTPNPVFMRRAIAEARAHLPAMDGGPFGACLVRGDEVLAVAHNTVLKDLDPTCHGETNAIRLAARKLKNYDLSGCDIYSTTEPCPMCFIRISTAGCDTKYCTPGPEDGMVTRISCLPPSWQEMASKQKVELGDCSPEMQKLSHLLFYSYLLDNRGPY